MQESFKTSARSLLVACDWNSGQTELSMSGIYLQKEDGKGEEPDFWGRAQIITPFTLLPMVWLDSWGPHLGPQQL